MIETNNITHMRQGAFDVVGPQPIFGKIYLDMDGVLMDFERHRARWIPRWEKREYHHLPRDQWTTEEAVRDATLQAVMSMPDFWRIMPPMWDARLLWEFCRGFQGQPHVLTATPANATYRDRCAADKLYSLHKHFDSSFPLEQFNAVLRSQKRDMAQHRGARNILVDDMRPNCEEWEAAGGVAILHTDASSTIKKLQELLHV